MNTLTWKCRQARAIPFVAPDAVAGGIQPRAHAGFAHPAEYEFICRSLLARQVDPRQAAGLLRVACERVAALHDAAWIEHGARIY